MAQALTFNFSTFGDRRTASSRLRAWMFADELRARGFHVTVNEDVSADVQVFQKVRPIPRLRQALADKSLVVYDFDDHYLLEDVGARDDVLRFMNMAALVTAGSQLLGEDATQFHERVHIVENPLDVPPGRQPRSERTWRGRLGWFGNRTNLASLDGLQLRTSVTTVTQHGDIEWHLDTIDDVLEDFDAVLLPVTTTEWTRAKNANRLLKCVALGVPFLASRTEEHEKVVSRLGLPPSLLIEDGADWDEAIQRLSVVYHEVTGQITAARTRALKEFGIEAAVDRWLEIVMATSTERSKKPTVAARPILRDTHVVVLNENEPELAAATLQSLGVEDVRYAGVTVVSAFDYSDFFEIYAGLSDALSAVESRHTLILKAGTELRPGFSRELEQLADDAGIVVFTPQLGRPELDSVPAPPSDLDALVVRPWLPHVLALPTAAVQAAGGLEKGLASLALWELLIRLFADPRLDVRVSTTPVAVIAPRIHHRHTIQSYAVHLKAKHPAVAEELPGQDSEWLRLKFTLQVAALQRNTKILGDRMPTAIAQLELRLAESYLRERRVEKELAKLEEAYIERRRQHELTEQEKRALQAELDGRMAVPVLDAESLGVSAEVFELARSILDEAP